MLLGKILISGTIEVKTGLRVGGFTGGLKIGGVDLNVITDPDGKPYIPGSSLKGKLRSLMERKQGKIRPDGKVHYCKTDEEYKSCPICKIWGISPSERDININIGTITRIIVRDVFLEQRCAKELEANKNIELTWTEVKVENVIDRIKGSARDPRQIERVPAGAIFRPMEIIYNIFEEDDIENLKAVFEALALLEQDYLGGMGSRGYGKVEFRDIEIFWNRREDYESGELNCNLINGDFKTPADIIKNFNEIAQKIKKEE